MSITSAPATGLPTDGIDLRDNPNGITITPTFAPASGDVFDTVACEKRSAAIKDENGKVLFEQTDCEIPAAWSQLATNVVVSKYFYGENGTPEREKSVRQLIHRVTRTIADWGVADGYFATAADGERFYRELTWLCLHQHGAFNSPVWFNVGLSQEYGVRGGSGNWRWCKETQRAVRCTDDRLHPTGSACFILSVADDMESIMGLARDEAMVFKHGSGAGSNLSTLRSTYEKLAGGGKPSGPLSFMRVYDQVAGVVKSGGKTRRAAKMQILDDSHPDVLDFIECKSKEERKARALIAAGYDSNFNGEAYSSVFFQNANLSVRLSDEFMRAVEADAEWTTKFVTDPSKSGPAYKARELFAKIGEGAHFCGDPGVQFSTTINRWHTVPNSGAINASNPCSEFVHLDDTSCNLASINLMKFRNADGSFDVERFKKACRIFFIAQEILVDNASYPTEKLAANSHRFRPLGLGYANLGSLIMANGLAYDSDEARGLCGAITALLTGSAYLTSAELAKAVGPFDGYAENRDEMLRVIISHRSAVDHIDKSCPQILYAAANATWWQAYDEGRIHGFRNAQATVLAPTGTIGFLMDCDTTGIEPDIALVKYKQLAGGGMMKYANRGVAAALASLDYSQTAIDYVLAYIEKYDTIEGCTALEERHLPVFDCAFAPANGKRSIPWKAHLLMMAAAQPFLSGAISKTVNMPREATPADICDAYLLGWKLGLKAIAVYRDGSKESQPLSTSSEADKKAAKAVVAAPKRERLPDTRQSVTHKFSVANHEGYITVGLYPDGRPGELFVTMAKEGSTVGGMMDAFATSMSMGLQYGVPLADYVRKFSHARFEPMGLTGNPEIRIAKSIVDYIARWLELTFAAKPETVVPVEAVAPEPVRTAANDRDAQFAGFQSDAPSCPRCGAITVRNGNCYLCHSCGDSLGCS